MEDEKQFETIAKLRAYAQQIVDAAPNDLRPSTAHYLRKIVARMFEVQRDLECRS